MTRFRCGPCAVAAVLSLALAATAQAQYAYVQSSPAAYSGYGYAQPSGYGYSPAYTYRLSPTPSYSGYGYSQPSYGYGYAQPSYAAPVTQTYYGYSYSRGYPQAGQGYFQTSRLTYASYNRTPTYSPGYGITQPYYYPTRGYGTMTTAVLPSGYSVRSYQVPFQVR